MSASARPQPQPSEIIMQFATGYIASSILNVAIRLNVADLIGDDAKNVAELARGAQVNEDALYRVLRGLAMLGIFDEISPRVFRNTPPSMVLKSNHPQTIRSMALWISDPWHFEMYADLMPSVKDGKSIIEHIYNKPCFDVLFGESGEADGFNDAMTNFSAAVIPAVLEVYDFSGIGTLADIAGGHGFVLTAILEKYAQMKGILFDLDHVVAGGQLRIQGMGLAGRCRTSSGDFFKDVPAADAYVMKHIIHDWDDDRAATILKNCAQHLPIGGKVILIEAVVPPGNEPHFAKMLDIEMLALPGGRERTRDEFAILLKRSGLHLSRVIETKSPLCVVEAVKI